MKKIKLRMFDGESSAGATAGDAARTGRAESGTQDAAESGVQDDAAGTVNDGKPTFEELIKGEYRRDYEDTVQKIVKKRLKDNGELKQRYEKINPVVSLLARRYGVDAKDIDGIISAVENDDALYEAEALEKGMSVEQVRELSRLQRENERLRESVEQHNRDAAAEEIYRNWMDEGEALKETYPDFDLESEISNENFAGLLRNGIDVRTAYEVAHHDEIMMGAMQATARQVKRSVVEDIKANGSRPRENGTGNNPGVQVRTDPGAWSSEEIREVIRRTQNGEKVRI